MTGNNTAEAQRQAEALFAAGQLAFERGSYRESVTAFEEGNELAGSNTLLGGTIQLWLMNAYSAAGRLEDAIALGQSLAKHPDSDVRNQSRRVLEILQAPQLKRRADWLTPIPDLSNLEDQGSQVVSQYNPVSPKSPKSESTPPEDLSTMNTRDNGFLWLALVAVLLTLSGVWLVQAR